MRCLYGCGAIPARGHHHPSRQVIDGDFADGAGRFHRQGAAGGVGVNDQTVVCGNAPRASASQVALPDVTEVQRHVVLVADVVEETEDFLRHAGSATVGAFGYALQLSEFRFCKFRPCASGGDAARLQRIARQRIPQRMERSVVPIFLLFPLKLPKGRRAARRCNCWRGKGWHCQCGRCSC